jgi:hypothetical protein
MTTTIRPSSETGVLRRLRRAPRVGPYMNLDAALWLAQIVVSFVFFFIGSDRALTPIRDVEMRVGWVRDVAAQLPLRTVGTLELVLALGVIVPSITHFFPKTAAVSAAALALVCVGGATAHVMEGEWTRVVTSVILFVLCAFIAYGRGFLAPVEKMFVDEEF